MNKRALAISLVGLFPALAAPAGSELEMNRLLAMNLKQLTEMEVFISTSTPQTVAAAPSVVSVITQDDIKATGATNLVEILSSIPSIYIRPILFGFRPQITMRGAVSQQTLLMVDGTPLKDLFWNAGIFWKGLPTNIIDRIEIIRGPGSALYGSDASSGVINVITKAAAGVKKSEVTVRAGSFDTQEVFAQHGGSWNGFDFSFTAELYRTDGHSPFIERDRQTSADQSNNTLVSYAPGRANYGWDNQDIRLSVGKGNWRFQADSSRRTEVEMGLTGAAVLEREAQGNDSRLNFSLLYDNPRFAKDWGLNSKLVYQELDYSSGYGFFERPPGYKDGSGTYPDGQVNRMRSAERGYIFEVSGLYSGFKDHSIRVGGGYNLRDLYLVEQYRNYGKAPDGSMLTAGGPLVDVSDSPYAFSPEKDREVGYLFLQDVWKIADSWELTAGARYDSYSDFDGAFDPRLALVWKTTEQLTSKVMYGRAFRVPSYLELYGLTSATQANPDLVPEETETLDLSFTYMATKDLRLGLDLYRFDQTDGIGEINSRYENSEDSTSHGIEFEAMWQATSDLRLSGNFSVREDDLEYNYVPKHLAYLRSDWEFMPHWNWNVQANWIGDHELKVKDVRDPIDAYTLVDTTLRYTPRKNLELAASVRNLFDEDAREHSSTGIPDNLPLPERNFYVEVRYKF